MHGLGEATDTEGTQQRWPGPPQPATPPTFILPSKAPWDGPHPCWPTKGPPTVTASRPSGVNGPFSPHGANQHGRRALAEWHR